MNKTKKLSIIALACILLSLATTSASAADSTDTAAFLGFSALICGVLVAVFIVFILIAIWVYRDAEKRGSSGVLWLIIVIITGIVGLIIWLVVRPPIGGKAGQGAGRMCPNCGRPIPMDARVCPYCGKNFQA